jgi:hypothetical protein
MSTMGILTHRGSAEVGKSVVVDRNVGEGLRLAPIISCHYDGPIRFLSTVLAQTDTPARREQVSREQGLVVVQYFS